MSSSVEPNQFGRMVTPWNRLTAPIFAVWVILLLWGFWDLLLYANTPGAPAKDPPRWPISSKLKRVPGFSTLVVFVHPRCPCSEASIGELARLMPHIRDKVKALIVFYQPETRSDEWMKSRLWKQAGEIPFVRKVVDRGGEEYRRFGALTSGQAFLFDPQGELVFSGGLTPARGHMGDSDGYLALLKVAEQVPVGLIKTPVFGCSLKNPERAELVGMR